MNNPFTPNFGQAPLYIAGRSFLTGEIERALGRGLGDPALASILVGPRGTGKTALLSHLGSYAEGHGWIAVNVSCLPGMLQDILEQTKRRTVEFVEPAHDKKLSAISIGQLGGIEWERQEPPTQKVLLVASDIVALADKALDCKLAGNLVISLADHLQYAVERAGEGVAIENPLSHEVAFVYPRETELGRRGIEVVRERLGVELPESEVTSIALHLVNAEVDGMGSAQDMDLVMKSTVILERATQIIEGQLGQTLDRTSYAYVRFVAHLRFLIRRLMRGSCKETENSGLFRQAARDFPDAYRCAAGFNEYLKREYNWSCSDEEMLYLMMHVNRLRQG